MSICTPTTGPWIATSRVGATLLAPVTDVADTTGLSAAASAEFVGAGRGPVAVQAQATPWNHKYMNRPGSPPRGTTR